MQATMLQVLHAPAHVHGPRGAPAADAEDGVFGQALTSASDRIDGGLDATTAAGRAPSDHGDPAAQADDAQDQADTGDASGAASAQDPSAAPSLPAWLADLKGRADRAGASRSTAKATAKTDPSGHSALEGAASATASRHGPQAAAGSAASGMALAGRVALAPNDPAAVAAGARVKARGATEAQGTAPDRTTEALDAGPAGPGRATGRAGAGTDPAVAGSPGTSVRANASMPASAPVSGSVAPGVATSSPADLEDGASRPNAAAQRLTVAVDGEKVTIELRHAKDGSAKTRALAPEAARDAAMTVATPAAALRHRVNDPEHRPLDATAALTAPARGPGLRAKGQEEVASTSPTAGRAPDTAPATVRSPENPLATAAQAPVPAQTGAAQPSAALPGTALPVQRLRNGSGPLAAGAGDGSKLLAAAADRARLAASATAGLSDAEAAQRPTGSDGGGASTAARASSWLQALEAAVQQAGAEAPHGMAPDAVASPGLAPVAGESGTRLEASAPESSAPARIDVAPDSPQFPGMLGARVAAMVRDGVEQARIALNPEELGPVSVQIELAGTQVRVDLAAEVEATRVALEQALPALAGSLREAGFTLAGGGVFQQARDGGSGEPSSSGSRQDGGAPTARAVAAEPGPAPRAHRPQGLVDLYA